MFWPLASLFSISKTPLLLSAKYFSREGDYVKIFNWMRMSEPLQIWSISVRGIPWLLVTLCGVWMAERRNSKRSPTRVTRPMRSRTRNVTYSTKSITGYKRSEMCTEHIKSDLMKSPPKFLLFKQHGTIARVFGH